MKKLILLFLIVFCGPHSTGCLLPPKAYLSGEWSLQGPVSVAVINFDNQSERKEAGPIMANVFIEELFFYNCFHVLEAADLRDLLIYARIQNNREIGHEFLHKLKQRINVDAVIVGTVEEFSQGQSDQEFAVPVVELNVRLIDTTNGKILWSCHHRRTGDDYIKVLDIGKVRTVLQLAHMVSKEMIETMGEINCQAKP